MFYNRDDSKTRERESNNTPNLFSSVSSSKSMRKGRNINRLSITIPHPKVRLRLGLPHPLLIAIAEETLDFRRPEFSSGLWLLMPAFSLPCAPASLTTHLHCTRNAPLPHRDFIQDPS